MVHRIPPGRLSKASVAALALTLVAACGNSGVAQDADNPASGDNGVAPDELTSIASTYLEDLGLSKEVLGDIEKQLDLPEELLDGARGEGKVILRLNTDPADFEPIEKAFEQRYPYIDAQLSYGSGDNRTTQVLTAYRRGQFLTDVIGGLGTSLPDFREAGALAPIDDLINWGIIPDDAKSAEEGDWVGYALKYWGFCVNTDKVSMEELPETWDEVISSPVFQESFGLADRPNLFLYQLTDAKGASWAKEFTDQLFTQLRPSRREEGMNAIPQLVANGNIAISLPCATYLTEPLEEKGAPVSWFSPEPIAANISEVSLMENAENPAAARVYINWLVSSEGQLVTSVAQNTAPVQEDMRGISQFVAYADKIAGKKIAVMAPDDEEAIVAEIDPLWSKYWSGN
jgi:iron(III) transport system substrate-binding protein